MHRMRSISESSSGISSTSTSPTSEVGKCQALKQFAFVLIPLKKWQKKN